MTTALTAERQLSAGQLGALDQVAAWLAQAPKSTYCADPACMGLDPGGDETPHTHGGAQDMPVFSIGGLAGSGKTHLTGAIGEILGKRVTYAAPTNKAAAVLRSKLPEDQRGRAGTYHSLLYRPNAWHTCLRSGNTAHELSCTCGLGFEHDECSCPRFRCEDCRRAGTEAGCAVGEHLVFEPRPFAGGYRDLIIIDEASMVTQEQVEDIRRFGLPILLVGDHGQLPPVKGQISPWMLEPSVVLTENFRQSEESGIVPAALQARELGFAPLGKHGTGTLIARGVDRPELWDALLPHRLPPGPGSMIVTWTNRGRADINRKIHLATALAGGHGAEAPVVPGDRLISLGSFQCEIVKPRPGGCGEWVPQGAQRRSYNGETMEVLGVPRVTKKWADVVVAFDDPARPGAPLESRVKALRRIDLGQLGNDRALRPDERVAGAAAFDYSYCQTAHKAQGSEAGAVAVIGQGPSGQDRARWLYTAMTRAKSKLLVIT